MEIETEYAVNLFFPSPTFTQIYFEAIANALDAGATKIEIHISTDGTISPEHLEISVTDNGEGFTNERYDRFRRLEKPCDKYHKGLGRLVYLHYFSNVSVVSVFNRKKRSFQFSHTSEGDSKITKTTASDKKGTVLRFNGFLGDKLKTYDDLQAAVLKEKILMHFLPYLENKKKAEVDFKITIETKTIGSGSQGKLVPDRQTITPSDIPDFNTKTIHDDSLSLFDDISMRYILEKNSAHRQQLTAVSVDGRTVPITLLQPTAIPATSSAIFLFESKLFTGNSDSARQRLVLPEGIAESDLFRVLRREIATVLSENFDEIEQKNSTTKKLFEERYPHLTGYFEQATVGIIDRDEAIWFAQKRFFREQKQVLESNTLDDATFEKSLEVSSRTLTEYVLYRELIIKRLREIKGDDKEARIHDLIAPRYRTFHNDGLLDEIYSNNAWILDDKFMSFRTILSEATMQKVISAITLSEDAIEDEGRPDISMIFSADPNGEEKVDVVVIEIKRRRIDDKESTYASIQLAQRAQKLADYCPNIQRVWYFGVIEIDPQLSRILQTTKWTPLFSKGQVFYQDYEVSRTSDGVKVPMPTCLLSFDAIIEDAAVRNHTFLEILKHDIRKVQAKNNGHFS